MRDLESAIRGILPWSKEGQKPLAPIAGAQHQHKNHRNGTQCQCEQMSDPGAAQKQQAHGHQAHDDDGTEIRFEQHESA